METELKYGTASVVYESATGKILRITGSGVCNSEVSINDTSGLRGLDLPQGEKYGIVNDLYKIHCLCTKEVWDDILCNTTFYAAYIEGNVPSLEPGTALATFRFILDYKTLLELVKGESIVDFLYQERYVSVIDRKLEALYLDLRSSLGSDNQPPQMNAELRERPDYKLIETVAEMEKCKELLDTSGLQTHRDSVLVVYLRELERLLTTLTSPGYILGAASDPLVLTELVSGRIPDLHPNQGTLTYIEETASTTIVDILGSLTKNQGAKQVYDLCCAEGFSYVCVVLGGDALIDKRQLQIRAETEVVERVNSAYQEVVEGKGENGIVPSNTFHNRRYNVESTDHSSGFTLPVIGRLDACLLLIDVLLQEGMHGTGVDDSGVDTCTLEELGVVVAYDPTELFHQITRQSSVRDILVSDRYNDVAYHTLSTSCAIKDTGRALREYEYVLNPEKGVLMFVDDELVLAIATDSTSSEELLRTTVKMATLVEKTMELYRVR